MNQIKVKTVTVTTVGGAGVAAGSGIIDNLEGFLLDIYFDYSASAPATTDVTVTHTGNESGLTKTILTVSNSNTDAEYAPRQVEHDNTGGSLGSGAYFPLAGKLTFTLAQCDALAAALVAYVRYLTL